MNPLLSIPELLDRLNTVDESHEIEAKLSEYELSKSALETISAFCNAPRMGGGYLLFGVAENNGTFIAHGVEDAKKLEQDFLSACNANFNRSVRPRVWSEKIGVATLVAAFVPECAPAEKPVFIANRGMVNGAFRRVGASDVRCTEDDLRELFQQANFAAYEDGALDDAELSELDRDALSVYRRVVVDVNPATDIALVGDDELVQSAGGARRVNNHLKPTVAGVLLFGKKLLLRRVFPMTRVDYIRVPGSEWVPDAERRYESIEALEALPIAFRRIYGAIIDDLPRSFVLDPGSPERQDRLALPEAAIREVLVNAITHRDYRVASPIQVIRFSDRIEVRNPGYSLADDDQLGEPGSFPRNPHIATVFREMRLAENKGTGIAAIRRVMQQSGLTPPLFDSDRTKNRFVATLWIHNLIGDDAAEWIAAMGEGRINDAQAKALILARRTGWVSNAMLRDLTGFDTLNASAQLKRLRELGLLVPIGSGSATHYVLSSRARAMATEKPVGSASEVGAGTVEPNTNDSNRGGLGANRGGLGANRGGLASSKGGVAAIPADVQTLIDSLGPKARKDRVRDVVLRLTALRPWRPTELAAVLRRTDVAKLTERILSPMVAEGLLDRTHPENLAHPEQAYIGKQGTIRHDG